LLALEIKESDWLPSLRGERAGCHMLFDDVRTGKLPTNTLVAFKTEMGPPLADWIADQFPSTYLQQYPEHLQHMTHAVEIARLPLHQQRPKIQAWNEATKASGNRVIRAFTPAAEKVFNAHCRSQAMLRSAMAAMACERYRL